MTIDKGTQRRIFDLWDALADFDATRVAEARNHLLGGICALIGARNANWIGAVRLGGAQPGDPVNGWRPRAIHYLHPEEKTEKMARQQSVLLEAGQVDETTIANVAGAGTYRVNLLSDLVPPAWFEGSYYKSVYLDFDVLDAIWAAVPLNEDAESYFGFFRSLEDTRFGVAEKEIVDQALRGLRWFHRQQMLGEGLSVASAPLTPVERRVLQGLLQGRGDKDIAASVGQSDHTTREYVKRLLRKYGVGSRAELMALWLGKRISP